MAFVLLALAASCLAYALAVLARGALARAGRRTLRLRVAARRNGAHGLFSLVLRRPRALCWLPLPRFRAGQSIALSLPGGALRRRYSLARWHALPFGYTLTIRREENGKLSRRLADEVRVGHLLEVSPPSGEFVLPDVPAAPRAVLIAGGVGITPLLAMIDQWRRRRRSFAAVHLYWQVRHEAEWVHRDVLERHANADPRLRLHLLASRPEDGPPQRIDIERLWRDLGDVRDAQYFVCAGRALLDAIVGQLRAAGVPRAAIHYERFGAAGLGAASGAWRLDVDGRCVAFDGHASILDACEDAGIALASDCRSGTCGLCRLAVLSGQVAHVMEPELALPRGFALACCAVPRSDLRLATAAA